MSALLSEVVAFVRSLRLLDRLSPRKNPEIIWAYIFLPAAVAYLVLLTEFINEKPTIGRIEIFDPAFNELVSPTSKIEVIATGFTWTEGPLWIADESAPHLLFSDTVGNAMYKWEEGRGMFTVGKTLFIANSGCKNTTGHCAGLYEPGTNGIVRRDDSSHDLIACSHGERALLLLRENGTRAVVADQYRGKRLNSPNDVVWSADGHLYFTDPDYGLHDHQGTVVDKELEHNGVYMIKGDYLRLSMDLGLPTAYVRLLEAKLSTPNGLAFSPDFSKLYISNSNESDPHIAVYDVADDGSLRNGKVFFDALPLRQRECKSRGSCDGVGLPDGLKVDIHGNVFATGPGGVLVISPDGSLLGLLRVDRPVANVAFGGDGRLYVTAQDSVLRVAIKTKPARIVR